MFNFFKKNKPSLKAPISGIIVPLAEVNDPVFSQEAMGKGFGIMPNQTTVYAPVTGTVTTIFKTKHALGLTTKNGLEILLHIGLDTVELEGKPFTIKVTEGQEVTTETLLAEVDFSQIKASGKDPVVLTLVTNSTDKVADLKLNEGTVKQGETAAEIIMK